LNLSNPLPGFSLSGDASFQTTSNETIVTNTSSYTLRASWTKTPHILNANFRYQTGSNTASSIGFAAQYGLTLRLKKLSTAFQARYDYSTVLTQTNNFSQGIYFLLSVRK
ncbi:MAG TPA: hypothetical protein VJM83_02045, partial [Nitrospirota bacterium]|nr:hypothetical protein [Nitrospirota bacterium]